MDHSSGNTQRNHPNSINLDDPEIILRLSYEIRNRTVHNFNQHVLALSTTLEPDLKRHLLDDNKRLIQDLIDLPIVDGQQRFTEFRLEFSLRNRLLANVAKNNLFVNDSNHPLLNQQFQRDLLDENNLLVALLNSLEVDDCSPNGAHGGQSANFNVSHGQSTGSFKRPTSFAANANCPSRRPSASSPSASFQTHQFSLPNGSTATVSVAQEPKVTTDGLINETVRIKIEEFSHFLVSKSSVFQKILFSNSYWVIQCTPSKDKVDFFLYCCEKREFNIQEFSLLLTDPVSEDDSHDRSYHRLSNFVLTREQSVRKTIWLDDLVNLSCIRKNMLALKVVIKMRLDSPS